MGRYAEVEKYRPCGRFKRCAASPGCGECKEWTAFLRLYALAEIEEKIMQGISIEQQKKEAQQVIQPDNAQQVIAG